MSLHTYYRVKVGNSWLAGVETNCTPYYVTKPVFASETTLLNRAWDWAENYGGTVEVAQIGYKDK